jgi:hypothetical protein
MHSPRRNVVPRAHEGSQDVCGAFLSGPRWLVAALNVIVAAASSASETLPWPTMPPFNQQQRLVFKAPEFDGWQEETSR